MPVTHRREKNLINENTLSHEIETYKGVSGTTIQIARDPEVVLAEAKKAAVALQSVLSNKKNPVKFNNEQYLEFEDWQTLAKFYGCTAKIVPGSTRFVQFGDVNGFEATAVAVDRDGNEISCAEAMCLNDEANWGKRGKFAWKAKSDARPDEDVYAEFNEKVKVKIGEEQVPLFQLRSMAQTRACAKALRNVFSWVVVLAGYKPTPAEELPVTEEQNGQPKQQATPTVKPPVKKETNGKPSTPAPASSTLPLHKINNVASKNGTNKNGNPYTKYTITTDQGTFGTFDEKFGNAAMFAWEQNFPVRLTFKDAGRYGNEILTFEVVEQREPEPEPIAAGAKELF